MPRNERTGKRTASAAGKALRGPRPIEAWEAFIRYTDHNAAAPPFDKNNSRIFYAGARWWHRRCKPARKKRV